MFVENLKQVCPFLLFVVVVVGFVVIGGGGATAAVVSCISVLSYFVPPRC